VRAVGPGRPALELPIGEEGATSTHDDKGAGCQSPRIYAACPPTTGILRAESSRDGMQNGWHGGPPGSIPGEQISRRGVSPRIGS
jgi:hypothetical protein